MWNAHIQTITLTSLNSIFSFSKRNCSPSTNICFLNFLKDKVLLLQSMCLVKHRLTPQKKVKLPRKNNHLRSTLTVKIYTISCYSRVSLIPNCAVAFTSTLSMAFHTKSIYFSYISCNNWLFSLLIQSLAKKKSLKLTYYLCEEVRLT